MTPRAPVHKEGYDPSSPTQREKLPVGIKQCRVSNVFITDNEDQFPPFNQGMGYKYLYQIAIRPEGYPFDLDAKYNIKVEFDTDGNLITAEDPNGDWKKKRNIDTLWRFFDAIGYKGGLNSAGEFISHTDKVIPMSKVADDIMDFLEDNPADLLCNIKAKGNDEEGWRYDVSLFMQPNTQAGWSVMRKAYAKKPDNGAPGKEASKPKPTGRGPIKV